MLSSCAAPIREEQWSVLHPLQLSQYQEPIDDTEVDVIQNMSIEDTDTEDEVLKVEAIIAGYAREIATVLRGIKKSRSYRFHEPRTYRLEERLNTDKKYPKALVQKNCIIVQRGKFKI